MSETVVMPEEVQTKETIPLWFAVAVTVLISVPFSLWLGTWNFTVWVSFIVWAEYFALGAKPIAAKTILPAYAYSALFTGVILWSIQFLDFLPSLVTEGDLAVCLALFVGVGAMVYTMKYAKVFQEGSLPFFNGVSMVLAVYFTGAYPAVASASVAPLWAAVWAIVMAAFGVLLAMFNVWFTFPKPVR